jgi:hypothetical protein
MVEPAEIAERLQPRAPVSAGREDVSGYAVIGLPFASGDILCLRRFPVSSFGPGYVSVWHRSPRGEWTVYHSIPAQLSCPRFVGAGITRAMETEVTVEWTGPRELQVQVPAADLHWELRLTASPVTRLMNAMLALMPGALFRSNAVLSMMSAMSTAFLAAGRFQLRGRVPNRQWFQASPRALWMVPASRASIGGRELGLLGPAAEQVMLGDFPMPQRGVFMVGGLSFEVLSMERHLPATARQSPVAAN